jgi:hypothetical protein
MSDYREQGIQDYWRHTYDAWDRADNARIAERDSQITRLNIESAALGRELEARQRREREARLERERKERSTRLEESIETFRQQKKKALEAIGSSATTAEWASAQAEWRHELERIDPCRPEAKSALDGLLVKVRAFTSGFLEGAFGRRLLGIDIGAGRAKSPTWSPATGWVGAPWLVPPTAIPLLPSEEQPISFQGRSLQSSLEDIESSLKPLVALCGAVQTRKNETG